MPENDKPVPTIILKLTDPDLMNVECDLDIQRLPLMRVILLEALRTVEGLLNDQHMVEFQRQMNQRIQAVRAMQKNPEIKM
jgi:hypothetical protein